MPTSTSSGHRQLRHAGPEAQQQPAEHEQDRIRDPQRAGQDQQRRGRDQQREQLQLLLPTELEDHRGAGERNHPDSLSLQVSGGRRRPLRYGVWSVPCPHSHTSARLLLRGVLRRDPDEEGMAAAARSVARDAGADAGPRRQVPSRSRASGRSVTEPTPAGGPEAEDPMRATAKPIFQFLRSRERARRARSAVTRTGTAGTSGSRSCTRSGASPSTGTARHSRSRAPTAASSGSSPRTCSTIRETRSATRGPPRPSVWRPSRRAAPAAAAAALGLRVELAAEEQRQAGEPEPGQRHDHGGERSPSCCRSRTRSCRARTPRRRAAKR